MQSAKSYQSRFHPLAPSPACLQSCVSSNICSPKRPERIAPVLTRCNVVNTFLILVPIQYNDMVVTGLQVTAYLVKILSKWETLFLGYFSQISFHFRSPGQRGSGGCSPWCLGCVLSWSPALLVTNGGGRAAPQLCWPWPRLVLRCTCTFQCNIATMQQCNKNKKRKFNKKPSPSIFCRLSSNKGCEHLVRVPSHPWPGVIKYNHNYTECSLFPA